MRIGIDCLRVDPGYIGGLNTYVLGLLDGFAAVGQEHSFQLYVSSNNHLFFARYRNFTNFQLVLADGSFRLRQRVSFLPLLAGSRRFYKWASNRLFGPIREMMESGSDVLYTPTVRLLYFEASKPTVLSMHDIQHVHYPEFLSWPRRLSRAITYGLSASHANYFQASSQFIRGDMLAHYPQISTAQIEVIPEGVKAEDFAVRRDLTGLNAHYRLDENFLFLPAQLWPHKNHLRVLRVLKRIERQCGLKIPLILTGAAYSAAGEVLRFLVDQDMPYVRYLGRVPFEDLVGLYQSAAFLLSPGLYESNSLPVLEAAAAGTPVIASSIPPNQELQAKLQLNLFDPLSETELFELILRLWQDDRTGIAQAAHNRVAVSQFSWKNAATSYLALFKRVTKVAA